MVVQPTTKELAKEYLIKKAKSKAYSRARNMALSRLAGKYQPEYETIFRGYLQKCEEETLKEVQPQLDKLTPKER